TATALVAAVGNAQRFRNGRELSAYLGLVPRQHSSGGKTVLLGITKRGDRYLRTLLIHGARSALRQCKLKGDARSEWAARISAARGPNVAAVAMANKNARVLWALLTRVMNCNMMLPGLKRKHVSTMNRSLGKRLKERKRNASSSKSSSSWPTAL